VDTSIRLPAVAGRFYPAEPESLRRDIRNFTHTPIAKPDSETKICALGCVVPHAGYVYSGGVAGAVYERLELPDRYVILCPNHTGRGEPLAIMSEGAWRTPLGDVPIDAELAYALKTRFSLVAEDDAAHRFEHALEVQLPFLQVLRPDFRFVPIVVGTSQFEVLSALGVAIASAIRESETRILVIASSDMNHYENDSITRAKDRRAIDQILGLNPKGLHDVVRKGNISMCGYGPTVTTLTAALKLGASNAELIRYATSGDVSGDLDMVVGYAGIAIS
jgi:AmmeMemoRadiSam system protein B